MAEKDEGWFRRPCLTEAERKGFEARLKRSRSWNRPQYLRIQASVLRQTGHPRQALALLERAVDEKDDAFATWVLEDMGHCHAALGDLPAALDAFRRAMAHAKTAPKAHSDAPLEFADLVISHSLPGEYQEALQNLMDAWDHEPIFPDMEFRQFGYLAVLLQRLGQKVEAKAPARRALAAASRTVSGAAKHPKLGLVGDKYRTLRRELEGIAGSPQPVSPLRDARRLILELGSRLGRRRG